MIALVDKLLLRGLQILMITIVLAVCWQVVSRYVLASPSSFTEELARFLLIWITMLGTVYAYRENAHLGLDMVYEKANVKNRKYIYWFFHICIAVFSVSVMVVGGSALVHMTYTLGQTSAVMGIDIGFVYLILPVSGIWTLLYSVEALRNPIGFGQDKEGAL